MLNGIIPSMDNVCIILKDYKKIIYIYIIKMFESSNIIIFLLVILIIIYFIKKHYEVKQVETFYNNMLNSNVYERIGCGSQNGIFTRLKDNKKINLGNKKTKQCSMKEIIKKANQQEDIEQEDIETEDIEEEESFYIQFLRKLNKIL
jgi:hypothetical protein